VSVSSIRLSAFPTCSPWRPLTDAAERLPGAGKARGATFITAAARHLLADGFDLSAAHAALLEVSIAWRSQRCVGDSVLPSWS
jgi:hypothetical protein